MDFNVHDPSGVWVGIIENPTSAIWARRYQQPGDFELYFPATSEMLALLTDDCFITREDAPEVMIAEHIEIITNAEEGNYIRVTGRGAECLLDRRVIWEQTAISGRVDACIYRLIDENAINPTDPNRALSLRMEPPNVTTQTMRAQYTGKNLLEALQEICKAYGLGFRAVADQGETIIPRLELLTGADRSESQEANSPVIFSAEYENLLSSNYVMDTTTHRNVALVAGEGEGRARKRAIYGGAVGNARREVFVDARDTSTNDGEISESEYLNQLAARGAEAIAQAPVVESFDGEIGTENTFILDEDYSLGDITTVENEYGIRKNTLVSAIVESWDDTGYLVIPTFENVEV